MNKIKIQDIDFSSLERMHHQGSKSIMYEDIDICYKILDGLTTYEKEVLYRKLMDMDGMKIDGVCLPTDLIVQNDELVGFTMSKFKNSMTIYDKFLGQHVAFKELFDYIAKACKILIEIHKNGIICQDLSFDNILVDNNGNVAFCDLDGCYYNGYESPFISMPMKKLICEYRKEAFVVCKNFDRISILVSLYYLIYNRYLHIIPRRNLNFLAKNVETIYNTMIFIDTLLDKSKIIPEVPYLDELIIPSDDYVMDREKEFNLLRRILKK